MKLTADDKKAMWTVAGAIFKRFGACTTCVKHVRRKMPETISAALENAEINTDRLQIALRETGIDEALV